MNGHDRGNTFDVAALKQEICRRTFLARGGASIGALAPPPAFDVLVGANGLYTSLPYYDFTTGLGTLDLGQKQPLLPH